MPNRRRASTLSNRRPQNGSQTSMTYEYTVMSNVTCVTSGPPVSGFTRPNAMAMGAK